jgi:ribosome-binding protein aMBF1 (putative translation factor)
MKLMEKRRVNANGDKEGCAFCRHEIDHAALGHKMRQEREGRGIAQSEVASYMKLSQQYVSDLELGRRPWTPKLIERYLKAVEWTKP